ncbi:cutinase [Phyllosticta capitalensis]|uniref:cutinase n=2 Tax=Phyllosticta capitalensis TaxID=121624 RepID=A0ABR1YJK7_9PEZI
MVLLLKSSLLLSACLGLAIAAAVPRYDEFEWEQGMINRRSNVDIKAELETDDKGAIGGKCASIMVVFARGTTEVAPLGTIVGPPLEDALMAMAGKKDVKVMGVDYPADVAGFLAGGDAGGSNMMAQMVKATVKSCPKSKVAMVGYSQGGQLVHNAAAELDASTAARVSSAVIFGDPDFPKPIPKIAENKQKVFCAKGDAICQGQALILPPHLSYGSDTPAAAEFIMAN